MSATGGRPAAAVVRPVGASVAFCGWFTERTADSTGVMLWVVATKLTTTSSRGIPREAAASSCANYASRYGRASVRNVQSLDSSHVKVFGYVSRGYRNEGWDCTFRSDGRITDFDL